MNKIVKMFLLLFVLSAGLTSCLDDGEETIALERGNLSELIEASWKVSRSVLYDPETGEYHSDFLNDGRLGYVYVLDSEGISAEIDAEGEGKAITWSVDEDDLELNLDGESYTIESLGKGLMVIGRDRVLEVNDEYYRQKYYLYNINYSGDLDEIEDPDESATYVVSTSEHGYFRRNGYGFNIPTGAVPKGDNGADGSVAFSAQSVGVDELPGRAPAGFDFVEGSGIIANPTNFTFATPILLDVPLKGNDFDDTCLLHWNGLRRQWDVVPYSSIKSESAATASTIELGYFALGVKKSQASFGGIRIDRRYLSNNYTYYLTLTPKGSAESTSIAFSQAGENLYMTNIPLGTYSARLTREKRTQMDTGASAIETTAVSFDVVVEDVLEANGTSLDSYRGWTVIDISSIEWEEGRPSVWGDETVTYGTGTFQATLNWINYDGSTTDYDLHLTTPNGTEVYYAEKRGGGFELDRDMISELGNCVENIYSVAERLPAGTYKVRVHHYGGATGRQYSCRVILYGKVMTLYNGITDAGYQDIYTFTLQ